MLFKIALSYSGTLLLMLLIVCVLYTPISHAQTALSVKIAEVKGAHWRLHDARLVLSDAQLSTHTLELHVDRLALPPPFEKLRLFNVRCLRFSWKNQQLECNDGRVEIKLDGLKALSLNLHFLITAQKSTLQLLDLPIDRGRVSLSATEQNGQWHVAIDARGVAVAKVQTLLNLPQISLKKGTVSVQLALDGEQRVLTNAALKMQLKEAAIQSADGRFALENGGFDAYVNAQPQSDAVWTWQSHLVFNTGGLYAEPVYLKAAAEPIELDTVGQWSPVQQQGQIDYFQYIHPKVVTLNGSAMVSPAGQVRVKAAQLNVQALDLKQVTSLYNSPFWVGTAFEDVTLSGRLQAKLAVVEQSLTALQMDFEQVALHDPKQRFGLTGAKGGVNWKNQADFNEKALVQWEKLQVYALPLERAKLDFRVNATGVELLKPVNVGFLGGEFEINQFAWQSRVAQSPALHFAGALHKLSLEKLTTALDWTPLTGTLSGTIPGVNYQHNRLDLEGALNVHVFDGDISIKKLAVANLLSDVPKFYSDINLERLDLNQLTGQFKFGSIDGLLSGFVRDLYLENWRPISFYAWLGTPENDNAAHRISQKAVNNIASIGGNGATDLISRGVLGLFDTFGYDQLGLGCYLHAGVCQLMGVSAAKNGYTIVKGGGLPRIDVVGYNPRVDWEVLVQRLERIGKPNDMVIK
ncbi:MAG: C4-dicarboxylate ABC transporter [Methylococcaceae bacterium]